MSADITQEHALLRLGLSPTHIVYCVSAGERSAAAYQNAYHRGVQNVLATATKANWSVARMIFVSSTGVYAQNNGQWVDEDSEVNQTQPTAQALLAGENLVRSRSYGVALRFSGIYGPGRTYLMRKVRDQNFGNDLFDYTNRIYREDCARVLEHLLTLPNCANLYVASDDDPALRIDVYRFLAKALGVAPPEPTSTPVTDVGNKRIQNARLKATGFDFELPSFREGYSRMLQDDSGEFVTR